MPAVPLLRRVLITSTSAASVAVFCSLCLQARTTNRTVGPSPADYEAAGKATNVSRHAWRALTPAGQRMSAAALHAASAPLTPAVAPPDSGGPRYPADLEYLGGPVAVSMETMPFTFIPRGAVRLRVVGGIRKAFYGTTAKAT
jgi:hypothetical protein